MQSLLSPIVKSFFNTSKLEDVPREDLYAMTVKYPYSGILHLLYAKKLRDAGDLRYGDAVGIAALHFSNPHWLNQMLRNSEPSEQLAELEKAYGEVSEHGTLEAVNEEAEAENTEMKAEVSEPEELPEAATEDEDWFEETEVSPSSSDEDGLTDEDLIAEHTSLTGSENTQAADSDAIPAEASTESATESLTGDVDTISEDVSADEITEASNGSAPEIGSEETLIETTIEPGPDSGLTDEIAAITEYTEQQVLEDMPAADAASAESESPVGVHEGQSSAVSAEEAQTDVAANESIRESENMSGKSASSGIHVSTPEEFISPQIVIPESSAREEYKEDSPIAEHLNIEQKHSEPVIQAEENQPASDDNSLNFIEPLHVTDYFASQGIHIATNLPETSVTKGLKSFNEWLRSMKQLHPEKRSSSFTDGEELIVKNVAESSNHSEDILTEAMAEVFAKQGLKEKAISVFEKLCLLDPSRSAIFAARISELKGIDS